MKNWLRALVVGAVVIGPVAAFAGIDNTHHDMPYLGTSAQKCAYCHSITGIDETTGNALLGKVGNFCVTVCHLAGSGMSGRATTVPSAPAPYTGFVRDASAIGTVGYGQGTWTVNGATKDGTVAILTAGHGMSKTILGTNMGFAGEATAVTNTLWPYTQTAALQCTSCHAIHDATNPPFLNAKLDTFCGRCHNDPIRTQAFGTAGNHPVGMDWDATAANGRRRDLLNMATNNINIVATNVADGAAAGALNGGTAVWNLGGHLINPTTGLPETDASTLAGFGCASCHAVHASQSAANPISNIYTVGGTLSTVCFGCHTLEPGRTGMGHPIGGSDEVTVTDTHAGWTIPLSAGYTGINAQYRGAAGATPMCVTCHDVHTANQGTNPVNRMAIRIDGALPDTYGATDSVCDACHVGSFANPDGSADQHHPGTVGTNYTTNGFPAATSWLTQDGNGNMADGLACQDCHVGDGTASRNSSAHNW